jgi:hypothetical protein
MQIHETFAWSSNSIVNLYVVKTALQTEAMPTEFPCPVHKRLCSQLSNISMDADEEADELY